MLSYIVFVWFQRVLCLSRIYAWAEKADFGCLSRMSCCPVAWSEQEHLQDCWTPRGPIGTTQMHKDFPGVSQHSKSHACGRGHLHTCKNVDAPRTCHTVHKQAQVRGSSRMLGTHFLCVLPTCIFFFSPGKSWRTTEPLITCVLISIAFCFLVIAIA